jgi:hypothetical protein
MRNARAIPIPRFAALVALGALASSLLLAGCKKDAPAEPSVEADAGLAEAEPSKAKDDRRKSKKRRRDAGDDRFDAKIAENLAKVPDPDVTGADAAAGSMENGAFRDGIVSFVRKVARVEKSGDKVACELAASSARPFRAVVWGYREGAQVARGEASNEKICLALEEATRRAIASGGGTKDALDAPGTRIAVELPDQGYSVLEHEGKGLELDHGLVPLRRLDKSLVEKRIADGQAYLLRILDGQRKGAHKYYYAHADTFEEELHTIYTASTGLTLLKLHAKSGDEKLLDVAKGAAEFMLSMQSQDEHDHTKGGFFYTFDLRRGKPERKLVVGTASKAIFTLLELARLTKDPKYTTAAKSAADWLVQMQLPSGGVRALLTQSEGGGPWSVQGKESTLYTGQVLSALSRTYRATRDTKYLDAAAKTASYLASKVEAKGCYVGDEYRKPNPISSSWLVLSLLDFARATGDERYEALVLRCSRDLVKRQWARPEDAYRHGRWKGSLSSSGTGWLAEVMSEVFTFCREKNKDDCEAFKDSVVAAVRQILQYTYSPENDFVVKNSKAAEGGVFWSVRERYVRTDSVCHAMNAFLNVLPHLPSGALLELPEKPLGERIAFDPEADAKAEEEDRAAGNDGEPGEGLMSRAEDPDEENAGKGARRGPTGAPGDGPPEGLPPMSLPPGKRPPGFFSPRKKPPSEPPR